MSGVGGVQAACQHHVSTAAGWTPLKVVRCDDMTVLMSVAGTCYCWTPGSSARPDRKGNANTAHGAGWLAGWLSC